MVMLRCWQLKDENVKNGFTKKGPFETHLAPISQSIKYYIKRRKIKILFKLTLVGKMHSSYNWALLL